MQIAEVDLLGAPVDRSLRVTKLVFRGLNANNRYQFTIAWAAEPYATYGVQASPDLAEAWSTFGNPPPAANPAGYFNFFTIINPRLRTFYRIFR